MIVEVTGSSGENSGWGAMRGGMMGGMPAGNMGGRPMGGMR